MHIFYIIMSFMLGATFMSFGMLISSRLPKKQSIMGHSMCDHCHKPIGFLYVIPFLGYFFSLGRCHNCHQKISICYPIIELSAGLYFILAYLILGISYELPVMWILMIVLAIESRVDIKHQIVLDSVWMVGFILLLAIRIFQGQIMPYVISSMVVFGILLLLSYITGKIFKKETLGGGDIKLYLFIGMLLPIWQNLLSIFFASIIALVYIIIRKKYNDYVAFVPFISVAVLISYLYGQDIINWYLSLIGM